MANRQLRIIGSVSALIMIIGLLLGVFTYQHIKKNKIQPTSWNGTLLDKPREIGSFTLEGIDHHAFTNENLKGHWTMMFFGFTSCGSICPVAMGELGKMYRILKNKNSQQLPLIVMISIDPDRDTPKKLSQYVKAFDPNFYGATGKEATIEALTNELGIVFAKINSTEDYQLDHSGTIILFNPQGKLAGFYTMPYQAHLIADDYLLLTSA